MSDLDLDQLRTLAAVVGEGSFDAAARRLRLTPSAVSQRIKALETATGRVLLRRTRPVSITPQGEPVLRLAHQIDLLVREALPDAAETPSPVRIPLVVNADSLATWVVPAFARIADRVRVDVTREDEQHSLGRLRDGSAMAAVSAVSERVPGCSVTRLGAMRYRAMATPAFAARWFHEGVHAGSLAAAPIVRFDRLDDLQHRFARRTTRRRLDPPTSFVPGSDAFLEAVRSGLGWGMLPDLQSRTVRESGALCEIAADTSLDVHLHWHQYQLDSPALALLSEAVFAVAAEVLA